MSAADEAAVDAAVEGKFSNDLSTDFDVLSDCAANGFVDEPATEVEAVVESTATFAPDADAAVVAMTFVMTESNRIVSSCNDLIKEGQCRQAQCEPMRVEPTRAVESQSVRLVDKWSRRTMMQRIEAMRVE